MQQRRAQVQGMEIRAANCWVFGHKTDQCDKVKQNENYNFIQVIESCSCINHSQLFKL